MIDAWASVHEDWGAAWKQANPRGQLEDALRLGAVQATGCRTVPMTHDQWAMTEREPIPVELWSDVELADGIGRWENMTAALRQGPGNLHTMWAGWLNVRFDGETIRQTFPGPGVVTRLPGRPANENGSAPPIIEFSERASTLAAAVAAIRAEGEEPSKGKLASQCARLYREQWGVGRGRATTTLAGLAEGIEKQWAAKSRERSKDWLLERAARGEVQG